MKPFPSISTCLFAAALAASVSAPAIPALAQTAPAGQSTSQTAGPGVASDIGAITLPVTVVDEKGNPVKGLTAADLKLVDNGSEQKIQSLSPATPTPMAFGVIGQTTNGLRAELGDMRLGTVHFVDHILPGTTDQLFVIQYGKEVDLLSDPTSTTATLHDAANKLGSPEFGAQNSDSGSDQSSGATHTGASGGTLYDAVYLAATEELKKLPGQHVIVLVSDGVDEDSKESQSDAVAAAQDAHTAIFAIYYKSEEEQEKNPNQNGGHRGGVGGSIPGGGGYPGGGGGYPGGGGGGRRGGENPSDQPHVDGKLNLEHMCSATGGYMIEGKRDKSDEAYNKLIDLLQHQYTMTFVPTKDAADSQFQRISLTTLKKDVYPLVQEGYTAQQ